MKKDTNPTNWDQRFIDLARHISAWSKDPSMKVGCVIVADDHGVVSMGFNGFPRGVEDDGRLDNRDKKYPLICHAEENAILHAAKKGHTLAGLTAYVTHPPCTRCARGLIQAGIKQVVYPDSDIPDRWREDFSLAASMFAEVGVKVKIIQ
jgi:dCMP deaminase